MSTVSGHSESEKIPAKESERVKMNTQRVRVNTQRVSRESEHSVCSTRLYSTLGVSTLLVFRRRPEVSEEVGVQKRQCPDPLR